MSDCDGLWALLLELVGRMEGEVVHDLRVNCRSATLDFLGHDGEAGSIGITDEDAAGLTARSGSDVAGRVLHPVAGRAKCMEVLLANNRGGGHWGTAVVLPEAEARRGGQAEGAQAERRARITAHELRQPLFTIAVAAVRLRLLQSRSGDPDGERRTALERISEQVERAQIIISRTLEEGDLPGGARSAASAVRGPADLASATRNAVTFMGEMLAAARVEVLLRLGDRAALVDIESVALEQVFVNLLRNGIEAIQARRDQGWRGQGQILVELHGDPKQGYITVADNGVGMARTPSDPAKRGFGLGLSICRDILGRAGGTVRLQAHWDQGAIAEIFVPLSNLSGASNIVAA